MYGDNALTGATSMYLAWSLYVAAGIRPAKIGQVRRVK